MKGKIMRAGYIHRRLFYIQRRWLYAHPEEATQSSVHTGLRSGFGADEFEAGRFAQFFDEHLRLLFPDHTDEEISELLVRRVATSGASAPATSKRRRCIMSPEVEAWWLRAHAQAAPPLVGGADDNSADPDQRF